MKTILKSFVTHNFTTSKLENFITSFDGDIILPETVKFGEDGQIEHKTKPGAYIAYTIHREGFKEHATVLIHKDDWSKHYHEDINQVMDYLHFVDAFYVDGATYGVSYGNNDKGEHYAENYFVTYTNYGDGMFTLYTNNNNSVFVFDDEDIVSGILNPKFYKVTDTDDTIEMSYEVKNNKVIVDIEPVKKKMKTMEFDVNTNYKDIVKKVFDYLDTLI